MERKTPWAEIAAEHELQGQNRLSQIANRKSRKTKRKRQTKDKQHASEPIHKSLKASDKTGTREERLCQCKTEPIPELRRGIALGKEAEVQFGSAMLVIEG